MTGPAAHEAPIGSPVTLLTSSWPACEFLRNRAHLLRLRGCAQRHIREMRFLSPVTVRLSLLLWGTLLSEQTTATGDRHLTAGVFNVEAKRLFPFLNPLGGQQPVQKVAGSR